MFRVAAEKSVRASLAKLEPDQQAGVMAVLRGLPSAFGRPHAHSGLGLRQLRRGLYEVRVGLHVRMIFERDDDVLVVKAVGDHDAIRRYLRARI